MRKQRVSSCNPNVHMLRTDVLVLGGGCAAARAALEARAAGAEVLMVVKGTFGQCGATAYRVSDIGSFSIADGCAEPEDSPDLHFQETMEAGMGMCHPWLVRILAEDAPRVIHDFKEWGIPFMEQDGRHLVHVACFGRRARMHIVQGFGHPVLAMLKEKIIQRGIRVLSRTMAAELAMKNNRCVGVLALGEGEEVIAIEAGATILATGGAGHLFRHTLYPADLTGDGYAMALRAGADLINMEFMQMGIGMASPKLLVGNWLWSLQPEVVDQAGAPILPRYLGPDVCVETCMEDKSTHWPFSVEHAARHIDIAIFREHCSPHARDGHPVYLDLRGRADGIKEDHPLIGMRYRWLLSHGVDIKASLVPIIPYSHSFGGGVLIDAWGRTTISGLYAAGETAGGMHGANRVGGNMLLACQVFGARAGKSAAAEARETNSSILVGAIDRFCETMPETVRSGGSESLSSLRQKLREVFWRRLMVIRNEKGLSQAKDGVHCVRQSLAEVKARGLRDVKHMVELGNMLDVGEVVAAAALRRKESRGSHYREDFPQRDEQRFGNPAVVRLEGGRVAFHEQQRS